MAWAIARSMLSMRRPRQSPQNARSRVATTSRAISFGSRTTHLADRHDAESIRNAEVRSVKDVGHSRGDLAARVVTNAPLSQPEHVVEFEVTVVLPPLEALAPVEHCRERHGQYLELVLS